MGGFTPAPIRRIIAPKPKPVAPKIQQEAVAVAPKGPTVAELPQEKKRAAVGRRGRRATILTSAQGIDEDLTLGYKTLLGG